MNTGWTMSYGSFKKISLLIAFVIVSTLLVLFPTLGSSDSTLSNEYPETLLGKAQDEFQKANYTTAIDYLKRALVESPENAEIYYHLGYFLHYLCYDSTPLTGYGRETSDEILKYLNKAAELDPKHGNAFYFTGVEYGVRARHAMWKGDREEVIAEWQMGMSSGGYPDWLIEYGRNILNSCENDAILVVNGDAEINSVEYLQCVERYRTDISAIPLALLDRPWFVTLLKNGLDGCLKPISVGWSQDQIQSMHPYKWKPNTIRIPVSGELTGLSEDEPMFVDWLVSPNLGRGSELKFLSAGQAALVQIIRTNQWRRPIHFSLCCPESAWAGLESNVQISGFVRCILPYKPEEAIDCDKTEALLLDASNFSQIHTLMVSDMPRVSYLLQNYRSIYLRLAYSYFQKGETETAKAILAAMNSYITEDVLPMPEHMENGFEVLEQMLEGGN